MRRFFSSLIRKGLMSYRLLTSPSRLLPNFLIIGAQKCGTSSLYMYLTKHPYISPSIRKETHFFDYNFKKGILWYRAHFPSILYKNYVKYKMNKEIITGEATPYYLFHPHAPKRIYSILPEVKLIVMLRNPVDRSYSHYYHQVSRSREYLSFEEAIQKENERLNGEIKKMMEDEHYFSFNHIHYSYLSRGIYVDQLKIWMSLFPKKQMLILKSEEFFNNPCQIFHQVIKFLGLPRWELKDYRKYNVGNYPPMNVAVRKQLIDFFNLHNQMLTDYLGMNFNWDK